MSRRLAAALWVLAALATAGATVLVLLSDHNDQKIATLAFAVPVGLVFIASGIVAWSRRPENRTGLLMVLTGFAWFTAALGEASNSVVFTIGWGFGGVIAFGFLVHLVLAYPSGRLETRLNRVLAGAVYALVWLSWVPLLFDDLRSDCEDCPENAFLISNNESLAQAWQILDALLGIAATATLVFVLVRRWRAATPAVRRALAPVYLSATATFAMLAATFAIGTVSETVGNVLWIATLLTLLSVPISFLVGLLRGRLARTGTVRMLVEVPDEPTLEETEESIRRVLHDPTLRLAYWLPERKGYVDVHGQTFELPPDTERRVTTRIEYEEGVPLAAFVHDAMLLDEPELLEEVVATVRLGLEKDRTLRALRAAERRHRALLDAIPDNMYRVARDGTYLDFKDNVPDDLVAGSDEIIGRKISDFLPAHLTRLLMEGIALALDEGTVETVEYEIRRRRGMRDVESRIVRSGKDEVVIIVRDVTDRRQQELALQRERDFVRTVVNLAPTFFLVVDLEGQIVRFNDTLAAASGFADDDDVRGRVFWDVFVAPERRDEIAGGFTRSPDTSRALEQEAEMITRAGEARLVEWWATRITDEHGQPRYLVSGVDVTERKRQQDELQRSRDFLDAVARTTPSLLVAIDSEGRVVPGGVNPAAEQVCGVDGVELEGRFFWDVFIVPEDRAGVVARFEDAAPYHPPAEYENEFVAANGERLVFAWFSAPMLDEQGRARFIICNGLDVTERERQEAMLRGQRDFLRTVSNATPSLLCVVDEEGRIADEGVNRAFALTTGFGDGEAQGRPFVDLVVSPEDAEDFSSALAEGLVREDEHHWITKDGRKLHVAWSSTPLPEIRGRSLYLVCGVDITERTRQEDELRRLYAELEARLEELQASRARIVEAGDAARRRLERDLHDGAQQRLVSLSLALRLAQGKLRTDPGAADDILRAASTELAQALEELRELARGIHPAVLTDRGLGPALESLASRIPLPVDLDGLPEERLPGPVEAAAFYVVSEALTNVTKYAKASAVSVRVRRENGYALVEVADDGVGGADPTLGSGLRGLADRVEALSGRLDVESTPGEGTRVRAEIPLAAPRS